MDQSQNHKTIEVELELTFVLALLITTNNHQVHSTRSNQAFNFIPFNPIQAIVLNQIHAVLYKVYRAGPYYYITIIITENLTIVDIKTNLIKNINIF